MIVGTILLCIIGIVLLLGGGKRVFPKTSSRIAIVISVFAVSLLNLMPPYTSGYTRLYIGSIFLAVMCLIVLVTGTDKRGVIMNLLGLLAVTSIVTWYRIRIILPAEEGIFMNIVLLVVVGALASFIVGRRIKYAFSIAYLATYIAGVFGNSTVIAAEEFIAIGGGSGFSVMVVCGVLSVLFGFVVNFLVVRGKSPTATEPIMDISQELIPTDNTTQKSQKTKQKKTAPKRKRSKK